jgi:hypothetical protein
MNLWRFNPITGCWRIERMCAADTAATWLALFQSDEPAAHFALSRFSPRTNPTKGQK